jgi:hypothetical protein
MADVTTYSRCTLVHWSLGAMHVDGEIRSSTDPAVTLNPAWWVALSDAVMASGNAEVEI